MKAHLLTHLRRSFTVVCGLTFLAGIGPFRATADEWNKRTILTVHQTIQVTDTVLDPGQYVLRLADSGSDRHIVQISTADQTHLISTVLAIPTVRLQPTGGSQFTFWETPPGTARAMRDWYYPGDNFGQEFPYPTHLRQLATTEAAAPPPAPVPPPEATEPAQPETQPEANQPETQPEAMNEEPQPAPPSEAETPAPAPPAEQPPAEPPQQLPKTASPYPTIGLGGAFLLGLAGLLRFKPSALHR